MASLPLARRRASPLPDALARKPIGPPDAGLPRTMGLFQATMLGVGGTIGTGIFVALTAAVPEAGPAVVLSFLLGGVAAALTALCYAEMAGAVPGTGASYTYAYAALGELPAFLVGACLLLEYGVSAAAVAVGWGQYLNELLAQTVGWRISDALALPPGAGGVVNLPAAALVAMCAGLLLRGAHGSTRVNAVLVLVKLAVLALFVAVALTGFQAERFRPFAPMGAAGVATATSSVFFSYIGIDAVATAGGEVRDPQRTLPRAIMLSLLIVTAVYVAVATAAVGAQPWTAFAGQEAGLAVILRTVTGASWPAVLLSLGAALSIFSVTLVVIFGQTRILYAMSRDGLAPRFLGRADLRANTLVVATLVGLGAALVPLDVLVNLTSMGTLMAFAAVSAAVVVLRRTRPDLPRGYCVPLYPALPLAGVGVCLYLVAALPGTTLVAFAGWMAAATAAYLGYARRRSMLRGGAAL